MSEYKIPRFDELPRVELYMDQVLLILNEAINEAQPPQQAAGRLKPGRHKTEQPLTASMINNYVKQGLIEPPQKKRYTRQQVAALLLLSLLKNLLPIADIKLLLQQAAQQGMAAFYDTFCTQLEVFLAQPEQEADLAPAAAQALAQKIALQKKLHNE